jgi:hypothetical protein
MPLAELIERLIAAVEGEFTPQEGAQYIAIDSRWGELERRLSPALPPGLPEEAQVRLLELIDAVHNGGPKWFFQERRPVGLRLLRAALEVIDQPWHGPDWDELPIRTQQVLRFMWGRERASLDGLYQNVWFTDAVTDSARDTALNRANTFLKSRAWPRTLHKIRGEPFVAWH